MYFHKRFWYGLIGFLLLIVLVLSSYASAGIVTSGYGYSYNPFGYDKATSYTTVSYDYNGKYISSVSLPPRQRPVWQSNSYFLPNNYSSLKSKTIRFVNGLDFPHMEYGGAYYYLNDYQLEEFNILRFEAGASRYYDDYLPFFWVKDLKRATKFSTYELMQKLRESPY